MITLELKNKERKRCTLFQRDMLLYSSDYNLI